LIIVIILAVTLSLTLRKKSPEVPVTVPLKWWQNGSIYRVYVASFADSDGDGIGDFKGIQNHLQYLSDLGVDILWLSPVQNTNTFGLDVIDFDLPKSEFGDEQDLKEMINATRSMGMKVVMDIILNQSGTVHKWFIQSKDNVQPFDDYYVWHKGKVYTAEEQAPNNWVSVYGSSAWQWNSVRKLFLLHQFWKTEPDLNYRNPNIIQEMNKAVQYWLDFGVDGFYLRDVPYLYEDPQFRDETAASAAPATSNGYDSLSHNYTRDLSESYQVLSQIFVDVINQQTIDSDQQQILMVGASDRLMTLGDAQSQMYQLVSTDALNRLEPIFDGLQLKMSIEKVINSFDNTKMTPVWRLGNEDQSRVLSKFDRLAVGLQVIQILLPGNAGIYYGEEIQMRNHQSISFEETVDVVALDAGADAYAKVSRDPFRTPMQWNNSRNAGFTSAKIPWLPLTYNEQNAMSQMTRMTSIWNTIQQLGRLKKSSTALLNGSIDFPVVDEAIFSFTRTDVNDKTGYLVVWNVGDELKSVSFDNVTYIADEMALVRRVKPEGSGIDPAPVMKNRVDIAAKEISIFSFSTKS